MVSKNSIYHGPFDGFQSPMVPKAPRSSRKSPHRKSSEGTNVCAFDLLAAIADKLLQESESSTSSTGSEHKDQISLPKESPQSDNDSGLEHVSDVKASGFLNNIGNNVKLEPCEGKNVDKMEGDAPSHGELCNFKSYSSVNVPFRNVKMGIRDDDENSFKFSHRSTKMRAFRAQSRVGYRRIRKMLISRYRKVTAKKDYELANATIGETKPIYQNRKKIYSQERCETETPKRRKLFHEKSGNGNSLVRLSIKSFKIPELYVEIPETATVGSLKRTVMEAVSAILGGELHVEILLEGKKVRDNNRTLQQTGISQDSDLKTLGFTLEPSFLQGIPTPTEKEPPFEDKNQEMIAMSAATASPITDGGFSNSSPDCNPATSLDYHVYQNQEIIPLQTELPKEGMADSKVLVPSSKVKTEALSVIPVNHQLTKKYEVSQRRIRRPFSVSEVEALVEAVETLGTGRWRDIKLRAFDDANHRTYVDLKDKWKTLVHTAGISPQQRRGEPVPQDLLDRVQAAHSYWSQHQRKHHSKPVQIVEGSRVESVGTGCIDI